MANETAAWGSVTIYAPTKDALEDFIYLKILSERNATYTTEFSDLPPYATPTEDEISYEKMIQTLYGKHDVDIEENGSYSVNLALCGVGRLDKMYGGFSLIHLKDLNMKLLYKTNFEMILKN